MELGANDGYRTKKRYEQLKNQNRDIARERKWANNLLLQECFTVLGKNKIILSLDQQEKVLSDFNKKITDLCKTEGREINSVEEIISKWTEKIYIIWDESSLPVIQTDLTSVIGYEDDIAAVAFETWIVSENMSKFLQFSDNGKIVEIII
ncbi:hypothetical protein [Clostridium sp. AN503]|uniref:CDI toxin immunity protein n=1 Tax=Clostridium sp. AN503 TaxID=3160598 RepID=UPI003459D842